jgi:N-acetylglucosaminyl-diphospho-decaprenol L-rhamnosyltransferase
VSTAVYVAYATRTLDLTWLPHRARVVVVHNDDQFDRASLARDDVIHVDAPGNIGFGAAVNLALPHVEGRVVLCNPDVALTRAHWDALTDGVGPLDVVTVPLVDGEGAATSVVSRYPTPLSHLISAYRLGRWFPRGSRARSWAAPALGRWGRAHDESLRSPVGSWPLNERWVSGAVLSVDSDRLRAVGGFDDRYFLYYEDVDLCRRLVRSSTGPRAVVADVPPGVHSVGASADGAAGADRTERHRFASAIRYAHEQTGPMWGLCEHLLRLGRRRRA